ncbi:MAG: AAA family ATPase [Verrucomicrobiales bacterium]
MIKQLKIEAFKSIQSAELELGQVNVFIGANGSGKSNLLEAVAVLSAAAAGKVEQPLLVLRGCRSSSYYRPMFKASNDNIETKLLAVGEQSSYEVTLKSPPTTRLIPWEFRAEKWRIGKKLLVDRQPDPSGSMSDPQAGLAALRLAETPPDSPASVFLKALGNYCIFSADTPILHGWIKDPQEREPVGLGGGRLADAVQELVKMPEEGSALSEEFHACVDWFGAFGVMQESDGQSTTRGLAFLDRYFAKEKGHWHFLSPNDVNEGVLYLAFLAVLGLHPLAPQIFAVENIDHGLNPLLAKRLMAALSERILNAKRPRQALMTTHNPLVLDGLPLGDDRVRLFTLDRDNKGRSVVRRFKVTDRHREMAAKGWTLSRMWVNKLIGGVPDV